MKGILDINSTISLVFSWTLPSQGQTDNYVMEEIGIGTAERERKEGYGSSIYDVHMRRGEELSLLETNCTNRLCEM